MVGISNENKNINLESSIIIFLKIVTKKKYVISYFNNRREEYSQWMEQNMKGQYRIYLPVYFDNMHIDNKDTGIHFQFWNSDDAMLFKLTWM